MPVRSAISHKSDLTLTSLRSGQIMCELLFSSARSVVVRAFTFSFHPLVSLSIPPGGLYAAFKCNPEPGS